MKTQLVSDELALLWTCHLVPRSISLCFAYIVHQYQLLENYLCHTDTCLHASITLVDIESKWSFHLAASSIAMYVMPRLDSNKQKLSSFCEPFNELFLVGKRLSFPVR